MRRNPAFNRQQYDNHLDDAARFHGNMPGLIPGTQASDSPFRIPELVVQHALPPEEEVCYVAKNLHYLERPSFSIERHSWELDVVITPRRGTNVKAGTNPQLIQGFKELLAKDGIKERQLIEYYLFCVNVNTHYLVVYPMDNEKADEILRCLSMFVEDYQVFSVSGDGAKSFFSRAVCSFLHKRNINYVWLPSKLTHKLAVMNRTVRTIRHWMHNIRQAFGNFKLMQRIVKNYNLRKNDAFGGVFSPAEVEMLPEVEFAYIAHKKRLLKQALIKQARQGMNRYVPGNRLRVHLDKGQLMKAGLGLQHDLGHYPFVATFRGYRHGNAIVEFDQPVGNIHNIIEVPVQNTIFIGTGAAGPAPARPPASPPPPAADAPPPPPSPPAPPASPPLTRRNAAFARFLARARALPPPAAADAESETTFPSFPLSVPKKRSWEEIEKEVPRLHSSEVDADEADDVILADFNEIRMRLHEPDRTPRPMSPRPLVHSQSIVLDRIPPPAPYPRRAMFMHPPISPPLPRLRLAGEPPRSPSPVEPLGGPLRPIDVSNSPPLPVIPKSQQRRPRWLTAPTPAAPAVPSTPPDWHLHIPNPEELAAAVTESAAHRVPLYPVSKPKSRTRRVVDPAADPSKR
jgi:hypothetical protein